MNILKILFLLWSFTTVTALGSLTTTTTSTSSPVKDNREELPNPNTALPSVSPAPIKGCGYRNPNGLDSKTHDRSNETQFGEFPWVVAVMVSETNGYRGVGVLIHPQVVLTVADSVYRLNWSLTIRAGVWDLMEGDKDPLGVQDVNVNVIRIHDGFKYDTQNVAYDIALLRLEQPLRLAAHINMICLPEQDASFDGYKDCVANGWGQNQFSPISRILKKVELDIVPMASCNEQLGTWMRPGFRLHESVVCAARPGQDLCDGDGGAPLVCPTGKGRYTLAGLFSSGIDCYRLPGLYTRVSMFRQWIDDVMASWSLNTR